MSTLDWIKVPWTAKEACDNPTSLLNFSSGMYKDNTPGLKETQWKNENSYVRRTGMRRVPRGNDPEPNLLRSMWAVLILIIIAWVLVGLFLRAIEAFAYFHLRWDSTNVYHTTIIAVAFFIVFLAVLWCLDQYDYLPRGVPGREEEVINGIVPIPDFSE